VCDAPPQRLSGPTVEYSLPYRCAVLALRLCKIAGAVPDSKLEVRSNTYWGKDAKVRRNWYRSTRSED
jgi:hypothetical protein